MDGQAVSVEVCQTSTYPSTGEATELSVECVDHDNTWNQTTEQENTEQQGLSTPLLGTVEYPIRRPPGN